ncbi:hypothetical protein JI721_09200 [Alicyclobacillus cycloheptanicus]|uniref:ElaB/YqjD/DUF883 family membrane-anchored ribosome-binding protein n=1 Tax=Alicyclobacillus cycloheptanicus TaxID=1457 RepID=A0ABT9XIP4_9BACL|nr:hypothetical protein [Alicyclobacillus cycloheptanicus]MDQ0189648.1 ElaB/YqjD/DUF883 family membrane-anchored ribosome-binding protein [Alicyclobacillus cycloheptanicus]WDL99951.1 hypothetical protein JI721_09200 [Alicyclobacillus cycloheptanicus]
MPDIRESSEAREDTLHDRTLQGARTVVDRALNYVEGVEKMVVNRAVRTLFPRVEQRIRQAPEAALRTELQYLYDLIGHILDEPASNKGRKKSGRRSRAASRRKSGRKRSEGNAGSGR